MLNMCQLVTQSLTIPFPRSELGLHLESLLPVTTFPDTCKLFLSHPPFFQNKAWFTPKYDFLFCETCLKNKVQNVGAIPIQTLPQSLLMLLMFALSACVQFCEVWSLLLRREFSQFICTTYTYIHVLAWWEDGSPTARILKIQLLLLSSFTNNLSSIVIKWKMLFPGWSCLIQIPVFL